MIDDETMERVEPIVTVAEPDAPRALGATMAAAFLGALGGLPPDWPDQTRVQISLELVRFIAGGQLAGQMLPPPWSGAGGNGRGPHG